MPSGRRCATSPPVRLRRSTERFHSATAPADRGSSVASQHTCGRRPDKAPVSTSRKALQLGHERCGRRHLGEHGPAGGREPQPRPDVILSIVDASNLDRHLYLTTQLMELGVPVVVSTDAHSVPDLGLLTYGVDQARRAALEARHVLNTRPLPELLEGLRRNR